MMARLCRARGLGSGPVGRRAEAIKAGQRQMVRRDARKYLSARPVGSSSAGPNESVLSRRPGIVRDLRRLRSAQVATATRRRVDEARRCVPNFSEGRDRQDPEPSPGRSRPCPASAPRRRPGASTNRTVVTFIGEPETVKEVPFHRAVAIGPRSCDMRAHERRPQRMGAPTSCPSCRAPA